MRTYAAHGINDFIICLGYRGYVIEEYFTDYFLHMSDMMFDMSKNEVTVHEHYTEPWHITLVDTDKQSVIDGRLECVAAYLDPNEPFCSTYGDGMSDVDITRKIVFRHARSRAAAVAAMQSPGRYSMLQHDGNRVTGFTEKLPGDDDTWINGGSSALNPAVIEYTMDEDTHREGEPMNRLVEMGESSTFERHGF